MAEAITTWKSDLSPTEDGDVTMTSNETGDAFMLYVRGELSIGRKILTANGSFQENMVKPLII